MKSLKTMGLVLASVLVLSACTQKTTPPVADTTPTPTVEKPTVPEELVVQNGDTVSVMYVGALPDGEVFDTNVIATAKEAGIYNELRPYEPLAFTVGERKMIAGFDTGVVGMKEGETKTLNIPAAEGYGEVRPDLVQSFPTSTFDEAGVDWKSWVVGEQYNFDRLQGVIVEKTDDTVTIDFNHFLAGKDLVFEVTMQSITR